MPELNAAGTLVTGAGGALLHDDIDHQIYADPAGHQLCLYTDPRRAVAGPAAALLGLRLFQHAQVPAPRWPDPAYPAQLQVDYRFSVDQGLPHFQTPEARAAIDRAEDLGAIHLRHVVYADPAGHPFCI